MKAQSVRLMDVFVIGPLMMWAGYRLVQRYPVRGQFLFVSGIGTVIYNGHNYLQIEQARQLPPA